MWEQERVRGHRRAGILPQHEETRHWVGTTTAIVIAVTMAVAAAATTAITLSAQAAEADRQKAASKLEAQQAEQMADAERNATRERNRRVMASADAAMGASGVQMREGSLLIDAVESAQYGEYDAELAAFPHSLQSERARFASKLFGERANSIRSTMGIQIGLSVLSSAASSYGAYNRGSGGSLGGRSTVGTYANGVG